MLDLQTYLRRGAACLVGLGLAALAGGCGDGEPQDGEPRYGCVDLPRPASTDAVALERVYPGVTAEGAIDLVRAPGDASRYYLPTQGGVLFSFSATGGGASLSVALDLTDAVALAGEAGLLGVAFHPDFASNGQVFVSYTAPGGGVFVSRVSRFTSADGGLTIARDSEVVVLELEQPYSNHNGGDLGFGQDGYLYFGLGDGGSGSDPLGSGQDTSTLLGAILRLDVDGAAPGQGYAIPPDNPFADGALGRPELYAWGLRNPWRFSFDPETGALWAGDVGQNQWEEVNLIERGGNYGWAIKEGSECFGADACDEAGLIDPVAAYRNHAVASVIAGQVYRGAALPELRGAFLYSDFYTGEIWAVRVGEAPQRLSASAGRQLTSWALDPEGELLGVRFDGALFKLVAAAPPDDDAETLPKTLSATGCFDVSSETGLVSQAFGYELNVPFWSDGASKRRWLALPEGATIGVGEGGDWELPVGAALVKTFELEGAPVETRLLVRHDDGGWAGYTYAWDEDGREARLLDEGESRALAGQTWRFPSRGECDFCHSAAAGHTLGLESAQLAREITGPEGQPVDQLAALAERGLLEAPPSATPLPSIDGPAPLEERARAYLHVNCSQCHRPEGPGGRARLDLRFSTPLAEMELCDAPPRAGDLGVADARLLAPGDPARSLLSARVRTLGSTRMPPVASSRVDEQGAELLDAWITALDVCPE